MSREEILQAATEVFRDVFDDESISVSETTTANDIEDWDSLEHINLVTSIEEKFNMRFTMGEVTGMKNVGDMVTILLDRGSL